MSAYIPFGIQVEIIKRVPVKSLIRFRSVSKQWKSLIDSSEFITDHGINQTQPHHLLLRYDEYSEYKYVPVVDDDIFPPHKFVPNVPPTVKLVSHALILDFSHGLVCLFGYAPDVERINCKIVIWNPSIRKSVGIMLPQTYNTVGFGVCPKTSDPTIVAITCPSSEIDIVHWKAEVFTLSSRVWRSTPINLPMPVPPELVRISLDQAFIHGAIYWIASLESGNIIISFDLTSEEFGKVDLPDSLRDRGNLCISKLKESVVVLDYVVYDNFCDVWMMTKNGDQSSFAKLFTVNYEAYDDDCQPYDIIGFTKHGQLIGEYGRPSGSADSIVTTLEAYEPYTKCKSDLGIHLGFETRFVMASYKESLLLLNHSDSFI